MIKSKDELEKIAQENGLTLDYLTCGSPIFQCKNLYTFTSDSISLAHSVEEDNIDTLIDMCAGSGVVGLEVVGIRNVKKLVLVELQEELAKIAKLSSENTTKDTEIIVLNKDVKTLDKELAGECCDVVTCNPPYFKVGSGEVPTNLSRAMARHEVTLTLDDIIRTAHYLLKNNGKLYLIHINSRLNEIKKLLKKYEFNMLNFQILSGKLERVIVSAEKM